VLDRDGFPKAHEIFEGNRQDQTTVKEMLDTSCLSGCFNKPQDIA
jgi:hypothetical protein